MCMLECCLIWVSIHQNPKKNTRKNKKHVEEARINWHIESCKDPSIYCEADTEHLIAKFDKEIAKTFETILTSASKDCRNKHTVIVLPFTMAQQIQTILYEACLQPLSVPKKPIDDLSCEWFVPLPRRLIGHKGPFHFLQCKLPLDVLEWCDQDLQLLGEKQLSWFGLDEPHYQSEGAIKLNLTGHIGLPTMSKRVNGVSNENACVLPRYSTLFRTILKINKEVLQKNLHCPLQKAMKSIPKDPNAQQISEEPEVLSYLLNSVTVALQSQRWKGSRMSVHDDGSAGMLLMGLQTSAGHRELHIGLENDEVLKIPCEPGHLYLCNVAAAKHQVVHPGKVQGIKLPNLGFVEVALVVRSTWFGMNRARGSIGLEGRKFFEPAMEVINEFLSCGELLRLPKLAEVLEEHVSSEENNMHCIFRNEEENMDCIPRKRARLSSKQSSRNQTS